MLSSFCFFCGKACYIIFRDFLAYKMIASSSESTSATGCAQIGPVSWKSAPSKNIAGI